MFHYTGTVSYLASDVHLTLKKRTDVFVSKMLPVLFIDLSNTAILFCTRWYTVTSQADEIISLYLTQAQK